MLGSTQTTRAGAWCSPATVDRAAAEQLELRVLEGDCDGEDAAYQALLNPGDKAPTANELPPGDYGFEATALAEGAVVAYGCVEGSLPSKAPIEIELRSPNCRDGGIVFPNDDGSTGDSGNDADTDPACAESCDDGNTCTEDTCVAGECQHAPMDNLSMECDDIACTVDDSCMVGVCNAGKADDTKCDDMNPCNAERCLPNVGCTSTNLNGAECSDTIGCTVDDVCVLGQCRGTNSCSDAQVCDPQSGMCASCVLDSQCDDGNPCTIDDCSCDSAECADGVCSHRPAKTGTTCDDGLGCTSQDACDNGACNGRPINELCDDGNTCTQDVCAQGSGCAFANVAGTCSDGVECTIRDVCANGTCLGEDSCSEGASCSLELGTCAACEADADCEDHNLCTDDSCMEGHCRHNFNTAPCSDGVSCTKDDVCAAGVCQRGTTNNAACIDGDPCTDDVCGLLGCEHPLGTAKCDDGLGCTTNDTCVSGVCRGVSTCTDGEVCKSSENACATCAMDTDCDDLNACTDDACMGSVCVYTNNTASCDDRLDCTGEDTCEAGVCKGSPLREQL